MTRPARAEPAPATAPFPLAQRCARLCAALCAGWALLLAGAIALSRLGAAGLPPPAWLQPQPECGGRCPLGLRPGWTDLDEAADMLTAHPWATGVHYTRGMELDSGYLRWEWTGAQPAEIDAARPGSVWIQRGFVQWVEIATRYPFGTLWQMLGPPQSGRVHTTSAMPERMFQVTTYDRAMLSARTEIFCPANRARYWRAQAVIRFNSPDESYLVRRGEPEPWASADLRGCR